MVIEILFIGGFTAIIAILLAVAGRKLASKPDPFLSKIITALPGLNCGKCGFAGCAQYAAALKEDPKQIGKCVPGGKETSDALSALLHVKAPTVLKKFSVVSCHGGSRCRDKAVYSGIKSCKAAIAVAGGQKSCRYGCLGFGDCVASCNYGAIKIGKKGYPVVDIDKCVACGACVAACPKSIINIASKKGKVRFINVNCSSYDKGSSVISKCSAGCIACYACEKVCPTQAIKVIDNLAVVDYSKCIGCGLCVKTCPKKIISIEKIKHQ